MGALERLYVEVGDKTLTKQTLQAYFHKLLNKERDGDIMLEWRFSTTVPLFKNKGNIQNYSNYRGIMLLRHTIKFWERVVKMRARRGVSIFVNKYGFMLGGSTKKGNHLTRRLMEKYRQRKKDLHMLFIDLIKSYDKFLLEVLLRCMEAKIIPMVYTRPIEDMNDGSNIRNTFQLRWGCTRD
ncbi:hypothetical protein H5410_061354 [Solanum commersonii]|uniref:Reverse transcriptase domain-containing protein n=1 Tax=Solanum commersonii TaxID=4109 RepID=A0A9J5W8M2_SOLCO|nr:hypothetical protein H5410_061354 [Solanum commersonii]